MLPPTPFPNELETDLQCVLYQTPVVNGTNGLYGGQFAVNLNSLRKPDDTNNAYFCYGWDQLKFIYSFYQVLDVTIDMTLTDGTASSLQMALEIVPSKASSLNLAGTTPAQVESWPNATKMIVPTTGSQKVQQKRKFSLADVEGLSRRQYEDAITAYGAQMGSSPAFLPKLYYALTGFSSVVGASCVSELKVTYRARMWGRNVFGASTA